jgi:hypothetical protein
MSSSSSFIFLAGAPSADSLDWSEEHLVSSLLPAYAVKDGTITQVIERSKQETAALPAWRKLDFRTRDEESRIISSSRQWLSSGHIAEDTFSRTTDLSFNDDEEDHQTRFMSSTETEEVLSQFYEHSFAIHEDIPSSQIIPEGLASIGAKSSSEAHPGSIDDSLVTTSTETSFDSFIQTSPSGYDAMSHITLNGPVMNIQDVPTPAFLHRISPQTITAHLVVGIISIESPRRVRTRRGQDMEIVELLTGDETRAGFGVNFWLSPLAERGPNQPALQSELRTSISRLRRLDVVLIKNVVLGSFRDKVYGQSLRREQTKIEILHRRPLDATERLQAPQLRRFHSDPPQPWLVKARKVVEWVQHFVGPPLDGLGLGRKEEQEERLPPDTQ